MEINVPFFRSTLAIINYIITNKFLRELGCFDNYVFRHFLTKNMSFVSIEKIINGVFNKNFYMTRYDPVCTRRVNCYFYELLINNIDYNHILSIVQKFFIVLLSYCNWACARFITNK